RRARHRPGPPHRGAGRTSHRDPAQGHTELDRLAVAGFGPSWVGVNPLTGKAQALWLIDPVYAAKARRSSNMALLAVATRRPHRGRPPAALGRALVRHLRLPAAAAARDARGAAAGRVSHRGL